MPIEEEASKNRKNTATLNNDTILTTRFGCLARTLAASNCTVKEIAIRFAMSTSKETNCSSPDSASVGLGFRSSTPSLRSSPVATRNVRGSAVNTMESINTEATSSSSDICASLAADSSSCPIPKETLKARSEPREPSAMAASAMSGVVDFNSYCTRVNYETLEDAVFESRTLAPRLAWQMPSVGGSPLVLRRLLVSPAGLKSSSRYEPYTQHARIRNKGYHESMESAGCSFGCTFGNLMQFSRAEKHSLHTCMLQMRRVLKACGKAMRRSTGQDKGFLTRGMGIHRVMKAQARHFPELRTCKRIDSKAGHVGICFGLTMSILIAFECMSRDSEDVPGLGKHLYACLRDCTAALQHWDLRKADDEDVLESRAAEHRAVQRAHAGVVRAQQLSSQNGLDEEKALRLQLDCFRRAAWPPGEELSEAAQDSLLERIESGELVDLEVDSEAGGLNAPGVASLSALPAPDRAVLALPRRPGGSTESGSSVSGSRSWSSWGSFAGVEPRELGGLALREQAARAALAERLNAVLPGVARG